MDKSIVREYRRFRSIGYSATQALFAARVGMEFFDLECDGKVRLAIEPEDDVAGVLDYLNQDCYTERQRKEERERADRLGVWGIVGQYCCPCCGEWTTADAVWGFVGEDWKDSLYDSDIMSETIKQYRANCAHQESEG